MADKLIPEIALTKVLNSFITLMFVDWTANVKKENTILHDMFNGVSLDKFNFLDQAVAMFSKTADERNRLMVTVGYNLDRAEMPTIHIILPAEQPKVAPIGGNEGYAPYSQREGDAGDKYWQAVYTYENIVTYNLLITSGNVLQTVLIYNWLKFMFVSTFQHFELAGFRNVKFGGSDLNFDESLIPRNAFHRNFNLEFEYEYSAQEIFRNKVATGIIINRVMEAPSDGDYEEFLRNNHYRTEQ